MPHTTRSFETFQTTYVYKNTNQMDFIKGILFKNKNCLPKVVPFAEYKISLSIQSWTDFAKPAITAAAFETVLVPEKVQCFEKESFRDPFPAACTLPRSRSRTVRSRRNGSNRSWYTESPRCSTTSLISASFCKKIVRN